MSVVTIMGHQQPLSPEQGDLQYDLRHLAEHNATVHFQEPFYSLDGGIYLPSSHSSTIYASPRSFHSGLARAESSYNAHIFGRSAYSNPDDHNGLGIRYDHYEASSTPQYATESPAHNGIQYIAQDNRDGTPSSARSVTSEPVGKTRSGRAIRSSTPHVLKSNVSKPRISKPPRFKSARQKAHNTRTPHIDKPLSELTKDLEVPVRDMDAWVNRSVEERQREVEKRNGYVARPMNSFMLYRSAYAERTKVWCLQNNHQVVSAVSGESWPMEPAEIREKYNELANVERGNHAKAHPNYKFSPSKGNQVKKKKEIFSDDEEDFESIAEDGDSEWKPRSGRSGSTKTRERPQREDGVTLASTSNPSSRYDDVYFGPSYDFNKSMWEIPSGGRPNPEVVGQFEPYSQYHQALMYPLMSPSFVDDFRMHPMAMQAGNYAAMPDGIPGSYHPELLHLRSQQHTPEAYEPHIDPSLSHFHESNASYDEGTNLFGDQYEQAPPKSQFEEWMEGEELS